jgi:hypothetical protein
MGLPAKLERARTHARVHTDLLPATAASLDFTVPVEVGVRQGRTGGLAGRPENRTGVAEVSVFFAFSCCLIRFFCFLLKIVFFVFFIRFSGRSASRSVRFFSLDGFFIRIGPDCTALVCGVWFHATVLIHVLHAQCSHVAKMASEGPSRATEFTSSASAGTPHVTHFTPLFFFQTKNADRFAPGECITVAEWGTTPPSEQHGT